MIILEKRTNRKFKLDGEWTTYNRDWNCDGDVYEMTVGFFDALEPVEYSHLNRLELTPWQIGPDEEYVEVKE